MTKDSQVRDRVLDALPLELFPRDQRLGAIAEPVVDLDLVAVGGASRPGGDVASSVHPREARQFLVCGREGHRPEEFHLPHSMAPDGVEHALEKVDEPLPPRIHDPVASKHLELRRSGRQSHSSRLESVGHELKEVRHLFRTGAQFPRPRLENGEDGPFTGMLDRQIGRVHSFGRRDGELRSDHVVLEMKTFGQAMQKLGEDGSRVAAGADQSGIGGHTCRHADVGRRGPAETRGGRHQGSSEIGPCICVGYREDVDAIEEGLTLDDGVGSRPETIGETATAERLHQDLTSRPRAPVTRRTHSIPPTPSAPSRESLQSAASRSCGR